MSIKLGKSLSFVLLALIITACLACKGTEASLSAEQIMEKATAAQADVRSGVLDVDNLTINFQGKSSGSDTGGTISLDGSCAIDQANKEVGANANANISMGMPGQPSISMTMTMQMYVVDNCTYTMMSLPGQKPTWTKQGIPADFWETLNTIESQTDPLDIAEVKLIREEKVGDIDCYLLEIVPDFEKLQQQLTEGANMQLPNLKDIISSFSLNVWVAKDTFFISKAQMEMTLLLTSEVLGTSAGGDEMTLNMSLDLQAHDYNQPVSIELPPEALKATEGTSSLFGLPF